MLFSALLMIKDCQIMRLIVRIKEKSVVNELRSLGKVLYVSELTNIVGIDTKVEDAAKIKKIEGVIDVRESSKGVIAV
ncbi:hypothetical protein CW713_04695 [Methanophagales archaeon]|nr:MAG: hypothetical protein CW713_04695 [Methanophagales archaeon]RLG29746.1 MAG: hypothetical protein DRN97_11410 [Methanosarcinales archaeon]